MGVQPERSEVVTVSTGERPLAGKRVLVTRARSQAGDLVAKIEACGGEVYLFPVITIADPESWVPLDKAIAAIGEYRWLVITSPNGAEKVLGRLAAAGKGPADLAYLKVAAVGKATARTLGDLGVAVDLTPAEFRGAALPAAMAPLLAPGDRVLMARGSLADPALAIALRALGAVVDDLEAYRTVPEGGDAEALRGALTRHEIDYVTLTAGSTVTGLIERLGGREWLAGTRIAVIGPETRKAAEAAGLSVRCQARQATVESLVEAIAADCRGELA
jgi:uroporphyrinogen III methyltransferase / synthase